MNFTTDIFPMLIQAQVPTNELSFLTIASLFIIICLLNAAVLIVILIFNLPKLFTKKILSVSLKIALNSKSHTFKFLRILYISGIVSGCIIALICFSFLNDVKHFGSVSRVLLFAVVCGILSGIITASGLIFIVRRITRKVKNTVTKQVSKIRTRIKRH